MTFDTVLTPHAPRPLGPYSQATKAGGLIFVAGQLPLDRDGNLVGRDDIKAQTRAALSNMAAILEAAGSSLAKVVKTTIFLTNLDHFPAMNEVYAATFEAPYPARSTVEIGRLPNHMLIEIECIALA